MMNILTFDIEDWYNCDFISDDFVWEKHEVRIYESVDRILKELDKRNLKGTFFCLGWLAEHHSQVIRNIDKAGHQIGCHSYQHKLVHKLSEAQFREDTYKAKSLIEDAISREVNIFRAPGFSITKSTPWAFQVLADLGFKYDCSIFPAAHDYGGFQEYGNAEPAVIQIDSQAFIKEFPMSIKTIRNSSIVYSGGGFFRLFPYPIIKKWSSESKYLMTYFHPRDFDTGQPVIKSLPLIRKFKSYYGIKGAFRKFQKYLDDFEFINVEEADKIIDWQNVRKVRIDGLIQSNIVYSDQ